MSTAANPTCPFCHLAVKGVVCDSIHAAAIADAYPVSEGHTLVIPRRHVASIFDLPPEEQAALWQLVAQVRELLRHEQEPDGFNIGVNDGAAAGQTIGHAHIHVILRHRGDVPDPRGGVRGVIPAKAAYWEPS